MERKKTGPSIKAIVLPLLGGSALSAGLFAGRVMVSHSYRFWFLLWNLFLAWIPLALAFWLVSRLRYSRWTDWKNIVLTALWLVFLPNSFYIISDFIHLGPTGQVSVLFDGVMFMSFALNGLLVGYISVLLVHAELIKRIKRRLAAQLMAIVFVLCSFAIYLGRYLAWNTWDILINPGGLLIDVSDRLIRPTSYPNTFTTTALFSITLGTLYWVIYKLVIAIRGGGSTTN